MKTIICAVCGKTVETVAKHQKYCPECKIKVKKDYDRVKWQKEKSLKEDRIVDTPENIAICLSCPLPECREGSTACRRGRAICG